MTKLQRTSKRLPHLPTMSTIEAAEALGLTRERVRQLVSEGHLAGEKLGRDWRVETGSVENFLWQRPVREYNKVGAAPAAIWLRRYIQSRNQKPKGCVDVVK